MSLNRGQVISIIEEAFEGVPQPRTITLHVAEALDRYDDDHDGKHRQKDFIGRWQEIPSEHIHQCQSALSFVDKIGMRYYLPAYMIWYLRNLGTDDVLSEHTLYSLDNNAGHPTLSKYYEERFSLFSSEQLRACALFIKFCANEKTDTTDIEFAKEKYETHWAQYENI